MQAEPRYDVIWPLSPPQASRIAARPARHARPKGHRRAVEPQTSIGGRQRRPRPALPAAARGAQASGSTTEPTAFGSIHGADGSSRRLAVGEGRDRRRTGAAVAAFHIGFCTAATWRGRVATSVPGFPAVATTDCLSSEAAAALQALGDRGRPACHLPRGACRWRTSRVPREDRRQGTVFHQIVAGQRAAPASVRVCAPGSARDDSHGSARRGQRPLLRNLWTHGLPTASLVIASGLGLMSRYHQARRLAPARAAGHRPGASRGDGRWRCRPEDTAGAGGRRRRASDPEFRVADTASGAAGRSAALSGPMIKQLDFNDEPRRPPGRHVDIGRFGIRVPHCRSVGDVAKVQIQEAADRRVGRRPTRCAPVP